MAHILTPILTVVGGIFNQNGFYVLEKICDTISIFQYQATIFYAQWYQMQSGQETKLSGINVWFIIEILSFYGYILAAILFILENSIQSSLGILDKTNIKDRYKTDFIVYHRREIDWFAFILILCIVNAGLIFIEENIVFAETGDAGPLRPIMY